VAGASIQVREAERRAGVARGEMGDVVVNSRARPVGRDGRERHFRASRSEESGRTPDPEGDGVGGRRCGRVLAQSASRDDNRN